MKTFTDYLIAEEQANETPSVGDVFEIEMARDETLIETTVVDVLEDGIVINADDAVMKMFEDAGYLQELDEMSATHRLSGMMKDKENIKNTRIPSHDERRIQVDLIDLTDEEFEAKHKMSKAEAGERFNEASDASAEEEDDFHTELDDLVHKTFGHSSDEKKKKKKSNKSYDLYHKTFSDAMQHAYAYAMENLGIEVDPNEIDNEVAMGPPKPATGKTNSYRLLGKDGKKAIQVQVYNTGNSYELNMYKEQINEADVELDDLLRNTFGHSSDLDEMRKPNVITLAGRTQDAFNELKDYAETDGGIDREEFEKAAYLVKAMGKPHLKDKAEGMLDELIGSMDSDPRDKVIQVLSRHIDLTFLKNLFDETDHDKGYINIGGAKVKADKASILQHFKKTFPNVTKIKKDPQHGWVPVLDDELDEAEYQGREVTLNKPTRGDVKKSKVYVKDPKTGNVKKVNFGHGGTSAKRAGQETMSIKKSDPARRKSFRARHNCDNPGPKTKARYWSCRAW